MGKDSNALKKLAVGTLVAGAAGYLVGVLSAPKAGKQTRKDIMHSADKSVAELEKQLKDVHAELNKLVDQAKGGRNKASDTAQHTLGSALDNAKAAKDKLREVITALHDGEATDNNLDKALEDAKQALEHLKAFLKK